MFILPDGKSAVFGEANTLKRVALTGGPAETIVQTIAGYGATCALDNTIIVPTMDRLAGRPL